MADQLSFCALLAGQDFRPRMPGRNVPTRSDRMPRRRHGKNSSHVLCSFEGEQRLSGRSCPQLGQPRAVRRSALPEYQTTASLPASKNQTNSRNDDLSAGYIRFWDWAFSRLCPAGGRVDAAACRLAPSEGEGGGKSGPALLCSMDPNGPKNPSKPKKLRFINDLEFPV
jgi:hypothetical protein